ncbi:uncharacterized protein LOC105839825 [Monomorium pharaonis]|uniref:uncharacterized protein LOC105839825 n=1 Tax=Monomorium pharaonis TaxID=307658 RepID=UPI0017466339|nr:uncharacterized protein LOC105839825 [Monomorium pharaonis]
MKRGARCVVQTINLSNPKTCTRPKVERLISADVDSSCDPNRAGDYWTPRPVAVRACSWRDARRKCSPKVREGYRDFQGFNYSSGIANTPDMHYANNQTCHETSTVGVHCYSDGSLMEEGSPSPRSWRLIIYASSLFMQFHGPPQKKASSLPLSTGEKLYRVVAFFVKGAIVTGLIYWTYTEGLWGDSTETEDLYYRMASVIFPDRPV